MANNDLNKRFFTNTYITSSGRGNYLRIDHLEDPLFTSFTFDIDYITSPLFYTINYSDYGYPNVEGLPGRIEDALTSMYNENMGMRDKNGNPIDPGYDILPTLSAFILDGNKLGFGLQQNVYMDLPLYGATEYIYMVDKRNGGSNQNDVRFDSNQFVQDGGNPNAANSYRLGDSVKTIVNESDKAWADRKQEQNAAQIAECNSIMQEGGEAQVEHAANETELSSKITACNGLNKQTVEGVEGEFTEAQLQEKVNELVNFSDAFLQLKRDIVSWGNAWLTGEQNKGIAIYDGNKAVQDTFNEDSFGIGSTSKNDEFAAKMKKKYGDDFRDKYFFRGDDSYVVKFKNLFNSLETAAPTGGKYDGGESDNGTSFLLDRVKDDGGASIRDSILIDKFGDRLEYFGLYTKGSTTLNKYDDKEIRVTALQLKTPPDWANELINKLSWFEGGIYDKIKYVDGMILELMSLQLDLDTSFDTNGEFTSELIKKNEDLKEKYELALIEIRTKLYGYENGAPCTIDNPSPDSPYGEYLAAKEKCDNDAYSQAAKSLAMAESGSAEINNMLKNDAYNQNIANENYNESISKNAQPLEISRNAPIAASQTVLDMLGFISGMKKMTLEYPYIIQGITGLDTAYKNHYFIKDPYLGSGDDKITLTCLESLDLRVSSMLNRYFNAVYDREYRRERVPINLRRFNCSVYVHDVRNFVANMRLDKSGKQKVTYNRILELTDMYHSVIEFRFFDCEIVPEETGNIFDGLSNEAPADMKKTNISFTYKNCVVNFVPASEVAAHNAKS